MSKDSQEFKEQGQFGMRETVKALGGSKDATFGIGEVSLYVGTLVPEEN